MSDQRNVGPPLPIVSNNVEFRVLIRGLKLDESTRTLIDAAIRSAVLHEVAAIDHGGSRRIASPSEDSETRSLLPGIGRLLGLILQKDIQA